jgi:hypothetical protein
MSNLLLQHPTSRKIHSFTITATKVVKGVETVFGRYPWDEADRNYSLVEFNSMKLKDSDIQESTMTVDQLLEGAATL